MNGNSISYDAVSSAVTKLYGGWERIPEKSKIFIEAAFMHGDYKTLYIQNTENEKQAKEILVNFDKAYPGKMKAESIDGILEKAIRKNDNLVGEKHDINIVSRKEPESIIEKINGANRSLKGSKLGPKQNNIKAKNKSDIDL